jgi:putative NADPH-quinone reductase
LTYRKPASAGAAEHARMSKRILVIQGHPDGTQRHLGHALADAYATGARQAGHGVRTIEIAKLDFPLLTSKADWDANEAPPLALRSAQSDIAWADHLVIFFPLWLGGMPAVLKGFFEQVIRPGFAISRVSEGKLPQKLLKGKSARLVVTMGMPSLLYRWYFRAHSLKALERNILGFVGVAPIHETLVGSVEAMSAADREVCLRKVNQLGQAGR